MEHRGVHTRFSATMTGALLIFLGAALLANPGEVTAFVVRLAGFVCAVFGGLSIAGHLLGAYSNQEPIDAVPIEELAGAGLLLFGGLVVGVFPSFFANVFFSILGVLIMLSGLGDILHSRSFGADDEQEERLMLRMGIVTAAVGLFVAVLPIAAVHAVPILCGVALVIDGLSELLLALRMGRGTE